MCIPTLPDRQERKPFGNLSENKLLQNLQSGVAHAFPMKCSDFKNVSCEIASSDGLSKMQTPFLYPVPDSSSRECIFRDRDSHYILPDDICDDFDEEILRELDDVLKKQNKCPIQAPAAPVDSTFKSVSRPCSTGSCFSLRDPIVLQSGVTLDELHDVKTRALEQPASFARSSAMESASVSSCVPHNFASAGGGLGGEPIIAKASTLEELLVIGDEDISNPRGTQYSTVESNITIAEGNSSAISELNSSSVRVIPASGSLSVAEPLIAVASEKTVCDTELPDYLKKLNESQREAALSDTLKPLLILAGPGSGKVRLKYT